MINAAREELGLAYRSPSSDQTDPSLNDRSKARTSCDLQLTTRVSPSMLSSSWMLLSMMSSGNARTGARRHGGTPHGSDVFARIMRILAEIGLHRLLLRGPIERVIPE